MIIIESNFGDGMFSQLLKPVLTEEVRYPCTIEEVKHSIQKERRIIDTLEPVMNSHKLIVSKSVVEQDICLFKGQGKGFSVGGKNKKHTSAESDTLRGEAGGSNQLYQLFYQLSRITFEKGALRHDDRLDALAIAVGYWVEHMEGHTDRAHAEWQEEQIDKELERFMESHNKLWGKTESTTWM
jgi:hypothetical protein